MDSRSMVALSNEQLKKYWDTANVLRKNLDAAEYKHIVLGLVFLKYVSDAFQERREELQASFSDPNSDRYKPDEKRLRAALEDRNYYKEVNVFWVPESSRWEAIQENAKQPDIATRVDTALYEIERENPKLEGIVERRYADARLPASDLGAVIDLVGSMSFGNGREQASDVLGQVYEYFLGQFATAEGKLGGQFYTTPSIVRTLVEILEPVAGRVYDPCCGSGGMFVQSERFIEAHGGKLGDIAIYGQESNPTTRRLCAMNLAIRGIDFDLGQASGDTFLEDQHLDRRFDYILMNPPFGINASYPKAQLVGDVRWKKYGVPREKPANYAWMSHAIHKLAPNGRAGIVMAHSSLTSTQGGDDELRRAFLDDDIVECIIDLPGQLFFNTPIPSCIWFFNKNKSARKNDRSGKVLFVDARKLGSKVSKTQLEFSDEDVKKISDAFQDWSSGDYKDEPGFCRSVDIEEIAKNNYSLSPGRYLGTLEYDSKQPGALTSISATELASEIAGQFNQLKALENEISESLESLGFEQSASVSDLQRTSPRSLIDSSEEFLLALFRSWFIDLDPDGLRASETGISDPGTPNLTSANLLDRLSLSRPATWQIREASEEFDVGIGRTPPRKESKWFTSSFEGVPWLSIRDMGKTRLYAGTTAESLTEEAVEKFRIPLVPANTVLMSFKLTVGKLNISSQDMTTNEAIAHFRPREHSYLSPEYTYLWLRHFDIASLDSTSSIGTATNSKLIKKIPFLVPPQEVVESFTSLAAPFFNVIRALTLTRISSYVAGDPKDSD